MSLYGADLLALLPELIVVVTACLVIVLDPITPASRRDLLAWLSVGALALCLGLTGEQISALNARESAFNDLVVVDGYARFWKIVLYGMAGSTKLISIAGAIGTRGVDDPLVLIATILLAVGFGFKLAAVPFHMWTPDVYQGAPTSVTAFMAVAAKAASFAAFMRVFVEGLGGLKADWSVLFLVISIITLVLGNVVAIVQTNIKRMLAYSSIVHAGYALIGFVAAGRGVGASGGTSGIASVMIYLAIYSFMTLGAFAVIGMLRKGGVEGEEIEDFTGLAKRQPLAAFLMLVFMVSLAGIPPTAGFIGKFYVFMAAVEAGMAWLAAIALVFAAVSAYYYMRVVMIMYMRDTDPSSAVPPRLVHSSAFSFAFVGAVAGVVLFGIFPNPLVSFALQSVLTLK